MLVTVYPEHSLILADKEIKLYNVPDGTKAKQNAYSVQAEAFDKGVAFKAPQLTLTVGEENAEYITVTGNIIKVNAQNASELPAEGKQVNVTVSSVLGGKTVSESLTVSVFPNYVAMDEMKELRTPNGNRRQCRIR